MVLTDSILMLIIGSATGLLGLLMKLSYSSKCKYCKCCCIEVERDTDHETAINLSTPLMGNNPNQNNMN